MNCSECTATFVVYSGEEDTYDVCCEVIGLAERWSSMCLALRLLPSDRGKIAVAHPGNPDQCLQAVVVQWLQKGYNYQRFGPPSWRMLAKAVGDPAGGNNTTVAEIIANKHLRPVQKPITTHETLPICDEEWDLPSEFADMLTKITERLNKSADVETLKCFLRAFCHPRTYQQYLDVKLYDHCRTPREIILALVPQYINFMHTHLLRRIVRNFGDKKSKTLLKQYEENFPRKKPLEQMHDPIPDKKIKECIGSKGMKVKCDDANVDSTTTEDVEKTQQTISRNTGIDKTMIVYANQKPGSVIFTFLIPESVTSAFSDLDDDSQMDLANQGILKIEVNDLIIIDLQSLRPAIKTDLLQMDTTTCPGKGQAKIEIATYTTYGMKRVPLPHDSLKVTHYDSDFQQLISGVGTLLAESIAASELKEFLQSFNHILYPEAQHIDSRLLINTESLPQILTALQPHVINFLNWGVLQKAADAFSINTIPAVQSYAGRFPPHTKLATVPDPLSEEEVSDFKGVQRLRVTCGGNGIELTIADVQAVREAMEKATGIDMDFIIFAYWEGGFTTHQFTFLIPKSISGVFGELWEEDLAILARKGVQRLEVDYDTVADNIYVQLPQVVEPAREDSRMMTKRFELKDFIPEDEAERMSEEEFSHLNALITSIPADRLQETCSNDFLKVFVKKMGSWKDLAPYLGISELDLEDQAQTYPGDEEEQKYVALLNWKSIDVNSATYERLVECLLTHGHIDDAKELLLQFQGQQ